MRDRRLAPTWRRALTNKPQSRESPLSSRCPLADPLAAASQKIRRKRGAGKPGDYDAILPTACARRGGIFLPRVARIFSAARQCLSYFYRIAAFGVFVRRFRRRTAARNRASGSHKGPAGSRKLSGGAPLTTPSGSHVRRERPTLYEVDKRSAGGKHGHVSVGRSTPAPAR